MAKKKLIRPQKSRTRKAPTKPHRPLSAASTLLKLGGHRGVAAGNLAERVQRMIEGRKPFTAHEQRRHHELTQEDVQNFVYGGERLLMHSTNVLAMTYDIEKQELIVEFKAKGRKGSGGTYLYSNISEMDAIRAAQAHSKGGYIWDNLRVRGSTTAHKKPFMRIG